LAKDKSLAQDTTILSGTKDSVRDWINVSADTEGDSEGRMEGKNLIGTSLERVGSGKVGSGPGEAMLEGEALGQVVGDKER
jgi:platelet-activating factor acetylhydrolase